jgi:hypothetical protein
MKDNSSYPNIRGLKIAGSIQPEWLRVNDAVTVFGLSRPHLFKAIFLDKVKSVHVKRSGAKKGIRLIEVESLRNYLKTFAEVV